jgi:hypothetical protein
LSAGASTPPPVRNQGPGRSLPGPDAGHPLQGAGSHLPREQRRARLAGQHRELAVTSGQPTPRPPQPWRQLDRAAGDAGAQLARRPHDRHGQLMSRTAARPRLRDDVRTATVAIAPCTRPRNPRRGWLGRRDIRSPSCLLVRRFRASITAPAIKDHRRRIKCYRVTRTRRRPDHSVQPGNIHQKDLPVLAHHD